MKKLKITLIAVLSIITMLVVAGCSKADRVSHNLSREADEMNITRKVTVINGITNQTIFQATGQMSIEYVEDVTGMKGIDTKYRMYFNPNMILPVDVKLAE